MNRESFGVSHKNTGDSPEGFDFCYGFHSHVEVGDVVEDQRGEERQVPQEGEVAQALAVRGAGQVQVGQPGERPQQQVEVFGAAGNEELLDAQPLEQRRADNVAAAVVLAPRPVLLVERVLVVFI